MLQQRLTARDLDQRGAIAERGSERLGSQHASATVKRLGRIAPDATEIAASQAQEDARQPGIRRFALEAAEHLTDIQDH